MHLPDPQSALHQHVIKTLLYYDIFNYPLKSAEVFHFLGMNSIGEKDVRQALEQLKENHVLFQYQDFFSIQPKEANVARRIKGNQEADRFLEIAKRQAKLISRFPFVRAVLASGSLSKGYMDESSDLDFFIITASRRLWIPRTLLVLYKRLFLFNSHKYFCVNYFVDEDHLQIEEKNLFTATELATVVPLYGTQQYESLLKANTWLKGFFPNFKPRAVNGVPVSKQSVFKGTLETILNVLFADRLEQYFRHTTLRRWQRLYQKEYSAADFQVAFKSKTYASKNHPRNYQRTILEVYAEKVKSFGVPTTSQTRVPAPPHA